MTSDVRKCERLASMVLKRHSIMVNPNIVATLRRSLLIKVLSRLAPTRTDLATITEMMAPKLIAALKAQSISFYIVEGNHIAPIQVCYSPSLWTEDAAKEECFRQTVKEVLALKIPRGRGVVG